MLVLYILFIHSFLSIPHMSSSNLVFEITKGKLFCGYLFSKPFVSALNECLLMVLNIHYLAK